MNDGNGIISGPVSRRKHVLGVAVRGDAWPESLSQGAACGDLALECCLGSYAAAARVAELGRPSVAGLLLDVSSCTQHDVLAISLFARMGLTVWIIGIESRPARGTDALQRGALPWSTHAVPLPAMPREPSHQTPEVVANEPRTAPAHPRNEPDVMDQVIREDVNIETADASHRYDELQDQSVLSDAEMRALLGASE